MGLAGSEISEKDKKCDSVACKSIRIMLQKSQKLALPPVNDFRKENKKMFENIYLKIRFPVFLADIIYHFIIMSTQRFSPRDQRQGRDIPKMVAG